MGCDHKNSGVVDSRRRLIFGVDSIARRRKCDDCGERFSTYELTIEQIEGAAFEATVAQLVKENIVAKISEAVTATVIESVKKHTLTERVSNPDRLPNGSPYDEHELIRLRMKHTIHEIAKIQRISPSTIRSRLEKAAKTYNISFPRIKSSKRASLS